MKLYDSQPVRTQLHSHCFMSWSILLCPSLQLICSTKSPTSVLPILYLTLSRFSAFHFAYSDSSEWKKTIQSYLTYWSITDTNRSINELCHQTSADNEDKIDRTTELLLYTQERNDIKSQQQRTNSVANCDGYSSPDHIPSHSNYSSFLIRLGFHWIIDS